MVLRVDGSVEPTLTPDYNTSNVLYKKQTMVQVVNTVAAAQLFSVVLPSGIMAYADKVTGIVRVDRSIRIKLFGRLLNNSGVAVNMRLQLLLNSSTVFDSGNISIAAAASGRTISFNSIISAKDQSQALQVAYSDLSIGGVGSSAVAPIAPLSSYSYSPAVITENLIVSSTITATFTFGTANALTEFDMDACILELL